MRRDQATKPLRRALVLCGLIWLVAVASAADDTGSSSTNDDESGAPRLCQGAVPARVVVDRVVVDPPALLLRNIGTQTANLTGFRLADSDTRNVDAAQVREERGGVQCARAATLGDQRHHRSHISRVPRRPSSSARRPARAWPTPPSSPAARWSSSHGLTPPSAALPSRCHPGEELGVLTSAPRVDKAPRASSHV